MTFIIDSFDFILLHFIMVSTLLMFSQEKYEKELKDTRARELMYAEEAAILDKVCDILYFIIASLFDHVSINIVFCWMRTIFLTEKRPAQLYKYTQLDAYLYLKI